MIVREHRNEFVMIEQEHHAYLSGEIAANLKESLIPEKEFRESVEYAIYKHDDGWKLLDKQPFWNDQKQAPFTFVDFPVLPKTVFYKHGIEEVEKVDSYAGLLCSKHYSRFLLDDTSKEAQVFVQQEEERQKRIIQSLTDFDQDAFNFHYGLLQLCDNLSLYICLNEPGTPKEKEHPFFQKGIPVSSSIDVFNREKLNFRWVDENTILTDKLLFDRPLTITLQQEVVNKNSISKKGLIESYHEAPTQQVNVKLVRDTN
ncbi:Protein of unknown function [Virgibacillus subterraneus]|uniref:Serine hydroxymethyltransferase n=1 Tax=Virgibacillus subterraneus TaxID=621109 RepID=A0A1H9IBX6_9BACI|nr:DUF3891 family protein [Virgibacillus subterraneus]SEQ71895.1 Protein of unknown function [Virgibacillus subterraneus]